MSLDHGGHLTHGAKANFSGRIFKAVRYGVRPEDGLIDYAQVERLALEHKPRMIIAGFSAYSRVIDWAKFRAIADAVGGTWWSTWRMSQAWLPRVCTRIRAVCRCRDDHHPQDSAGAAWRLAPCTPQRRDREEA